MLKLEYLPITVILDELEEHFFESNTQDLVAVMKVAVTPEKKINSFFQSYKFVFNIIFANNM